MEGVTKQSNNGGKKTMNTDKKVYVTPELTVHGNVEEITLVNGFVNPADVPMGQAGTAFPLS
jgi:hypothetical protein